MSVAAQREQHKDDCVRESLISGAKASAWALATSSLLVGLGNQFLPSFRSSLGVSGKTALIVSSLAHNQADIMIFGGADDKYVIKKTYKAYVCCI